MDGRHFKQHEGLEAHTSYQASLKEARALTIIKWAAMFFLIVDHVSLALLDNIEIGRILGRIAFPLFAYMIAVGAQYSSSPQRYLKRIFIFACISEIPFDLLVAGVPFAFTYANVLFTFSLALGALLIIKRLGSSRLVWISVTLVSFIIAELASVDYGGVGVLGVLVYYLGMYGCTGDKLRPRLGQALGLVTIAIGWPLYESLVFSFEYARLILVGSIETYALLAGLFLMISHAGPARFTQSSKRRAKLWYLVYPGHIIIVCIVVYALHMYEWPQELFLLPSWLSWL